MKPNHPHPMRKFWPGCFAFIAMTTAILGTLTAQIPGEYHQNLPLPESPADSLVVTADFQQSDPVDGPNLADIDDPVTDRFNEGLSLLDFGGEGTWYSRLEQQMGDVDFMRLAGSLAIVLGGYFGFVWLTRRFGRGASRNLPQEVVEVLGQSPFGPKKTLQLVRLGSKLLLLIHSSEGTQLAGEINDPHEVEYLVSLCCGKKSNRSAIAIRKASTGGVSQPTTDLKKILRQLQGAHDDNSTGSVFEA